MASSTFVTLSIIAAWYFSNIGVLLLNKYLLSIFKFKYPVFLTLCHMVSCTLMSYGVSVLGIVPRQHLKSRSQLGKVSVLAVVFCVTVVLGNVSLRFIPVSFNQAIGATTPAFTALMALLMMHQRETPAVYASLVPVVVGIIIASGAEPSFHLFGFITAISATAARAFKSVLQGMMLSDPTEKMDSLSLLLYMAPVATLALVPMTLWWESEAAMAAVQLGRTAPGFWGLLFLNSFLAYFVNLTNFLVTKHTSALTLQVIGNAKGVVAVVVSIIFFRNPVNTYSIMGYGITVCGVWLYSQAKKNAKKEAVVREGLSKGQLLSPLDSSDLEQPQGNGSATMLLHKQGSGGLRGAASGQIPAYPSTIRSNFSASMLHASVAPVAA